jgi:RNA polymerase sigma factor (sigma-70 family)
LLPADEEIRDCFRRIAEGELVGRKAEDEFYRSCGPGLFGMLRGRGFDPETAEDLWHDVFERVKREAQKLPTVEKARAWLLKVARNLANDYIRKRRPTLFGSDGSDDPSGEDPEVVDRIAQRQAAHAQELAVWRDIAIDVDRALKTLRQRSRRQYLALQCGAQGLAGEELASALGIRRPGTANQYLSTARKALIRIYAEQTGRAVEEVGQILPT